MLKDAGNAPHHDAVGADRVGRMLDAAEEQIKEVDGEIKEELESSGQTPLLMSIPGVGPLVTMAFMESVGL